MFGSRDVDFALRTLARCAAVCLAGIACMPAAGAPEAGATYDRNASSWMERSRQGNVTRPAQAQPAIYRHEVQPAYQQPSQQYGTAAVVSTPQSSSATRRSTSSGSSTKSSTSKTSKDSSARKTSSKTSSSDSKSAKSSTSKSKSSSAKTEKPKSSSASSSSSSKSKTSSAKSSNESADKSKSSAGKTEKEKNKEEKLKEAEKPKETEKEKQPEPSSEKKEAAKEPAKEPEKAAASTPAPEVKKQPEAASAPSVRPRWLPVHRPIVPARPLLYPWVQEVTVAERNISVLQPDKLVVEMPSSAVGEGARHEGPLVEFGRLADQRIAELRAYEARGQSASDGVTSCPDGRFHKAYFRFPIKSVTVSVSSEDASVLDGEIAYDQAVYVQSGDGPEAILKEPGQPSKDTPPAATSERYRFRNGEWVYVENK